jgi:very-short-patch-repair endonuclease
MLLALMIVGKELGWGVSVETKFGTFGDRREGYLENLTISVQHKLGDYQVDFLLTGSECGPDHDHPVPSPSGEIIPGCKTAWKSMIIECDGPDFHGHGKEPARHDRSRDRFFQSMGYLVVRYTGSEIGADVFKAADEAIRTLGRAVADAFADEPPAGEVN